MAGLYEEVLEAAGRQPLLPTRPPRDSAAIVPWRENDGDLEVLWIRRASAQRFMGGWYAFPGGGVARSDPDVPVAGEPSGCDTCDPTGALPPAMLDGIELGSLIPQGLVAAGLRELAEEVGWLVTEPGLNADAERRLIASLRGGGPLSPLLAAHDLAVDAGVLTCAGRWLTPPLGPMRFDNRFFLLPAPEREPDPWRREVENAEWIRPVEGINRWQSGEVLVAPPVLHILRVLADAADGDAIDLQRLTSPKESNLGSFRRIEFQPGVLQLPLRTATLPPAGTTNCFILGDRQRVVIDPGSPFAEDQGRLLEVLAELPGGVDRLEAIWLTHHHPDHIGGACALAASLRVPVLAHERTAALLRGTVEITGRFEDGQRLILAGTPEVNLEVVHTPGHAPGHLCFASSDGRWIIAGDMISGVSTIVIDPPEGEMGDYYRSLERLSALNHRFVLPAHGPPLLHGGRVFGRTLEHRRWREGRIQQAWQAGERDAASLVIAAYEDEDLPPFVRPLARRQVEAHLRHLGLGSTVGSDGDTE